jgi:hypothetical protein
MKAELKFWRWAAVIGVLVLGIVGSIAVAAPNGGGGGSSSTDATRTDTPPPGGPPPFGGREPARQLSDLADALGVSTTKLRDALDAVRSKLDPPTPPADGQRPSRADIEKRCTQETDALASELGTSGDKVRAAIKSVAKKKIEAAVDSKRLTRAQADRLIARIDDAACVPPMGVFFGRGHGCHGGRGHDGPGRGLRQAPAPGDSELPAAPPANSGAVPL